MSLRVKMGIALVIMAVGLVGVYLSRGDLEQARLAFMAECLADGKADYYCRVMWRQYTYRHPPIVYIP